MRALLLRVAVAVVGEATVEAAGDSTRLTSGRTRRDGVVAAGATLLRRVGFSLVVLLAIVYLSHFGLDMARGASFLPAAGAALGDTAAYLADLARGDLGQSAAGSITLRPIPVSEILLPTLSKTLGLMAVALAFATVVGVGLGLAAATGRRTGWSPAVLLVSIVGVSLPSFLAALLLQILFIRLGRLAGKPLLPMGGFGWDAHLILPALVLAARPVAQITRVTYVSLKEVLGQDYVRTAHGKGLPGHRVLSRHVLRNAAPPVLTTIGLSLRFALSSLPVVEYFFGWPGVGYMLLKAISRRDDDLTVALVLSLGALFILVDLLLDGLYRLVDPRLRRSSGQVRQGDGAGIGDGLRSLLADGRDLVAGHALWRRLRGRRAPVASPFARVLAEREGATPVEPAPVHRRRLWRGVAANPALLAGGLFVAALLAVYLFGPRLAPHSPYTTRGLVMVDGTFTKPPFAPGDVYPWGTDVMGRDMMSLILAGTQQTLTLAALVVLARLLVGFILGAVAGWLEGGWVDRLLLGAIETVAAYPALLLAMTLILALGIRQGMSPFVIALCFIGWGEIMQFVRAQVIALRPRLYIESAIATGARGSRIVFAHILPNLLPALISVLVLELGAVLMLLGELGFIGIFIGGGAFAEITIDDPLYHYSDVPEWGALLSNVRPYARSYTWTAFYPAMAFFVAILGLNLFGEGLRRLVEERGLALSRLFSRYTLAAVLVAVVAGRWLQGNTGAFAFYRQQAATFAGERAMAHVTALANSDRGGRAPGGAGIDVAADYIAEQFRRLGLQPGGESFTYFQTRQRSYEVLQVVPRLDIDDGGPALVYRQGYAEYPAFHRLLGEASGPVRFLAMGELTPKGRSFDLARSTYLALEGMSYPDELLLVLNERDLLRLYGVPRGAFLVVADDEADLARRFTLSSADPGYSNWGATAPANRDRAILHVSEATADRLLRGTGQTVAQLRRLAAALGQDEVLNLPTGMTASAGIDGVVVEKQPVRHVVGHLPGRSERWDDHLIVVLAQYDAPVPGPDGVVGPAANDNASGVAVMLEAIRAMQESGYQPYKTFLFIAYSGEGLEAGRPMLDPEVGEFLKAKYGFSTAFDIDAVIHLRGLGAGDGDGLAISAGGNQRLAQAFEAAARANGVAAGRQRDDMDMSIVFEDRSLSQGGQKAPRLDLSWSGWRATSRLPSDTIEAISPERLERAGRTLALALMVMGRQTDQ